MIGIYIHVPFCLRKCPYCDFYSRAYDKALAERYVDSLVRNVAAYHERHIKADTIYFGGGTPSLLGARQVERIISACDKAFTLCAPEITLECNPSSTDKEKLIGYSEAGVNRLSFGVQSSNDGSLKALGRLHSFEQAMNTVETAYRVGFDNISCDLMLATPEQTVQSLGKDIENVSALPIKHISAYLLKIERGTAFDNDALRSRCPDEDLTCELYLYAVQKLAEKGFLQYEISNFSKAGFESRHNLKYWHGEEYLGFGPAAHSFFEGKRFCCPPDLRSFIDSKLQQSVITEESVNPAEEYIMLGLRLCEGISLSRLAEMNVGEKNLGKIRQKAKMFELHGLCRVNQDNICLTPKGFLVSNEIIGELIVG